jgi:hypothetical protein
VQTGTQGKEPPTILEVDMKKQLTVVLSVGDRQRKLKARIRIAYAILSWLKILWWIWTLLSALGVLGLDVAFSI